MQPVRSIAFSPDGRRIGVLDAAKRVHVRDVETGRALATCDMYHDGGPAGGGWLAFDAAGERVVVSDFDRIAGFEVRSGERIGLSAASMPMNHPAWVGERSVLSICYFHGLADSIRLWDLRGGRLIARQVHRDEISAWARTPDLLATGSTRKKQETSIRIWRLIRP